ncbi:unnamed protein product [Discosporangium mesarthrocarpum]
MKKSTVAHCLERRGTSKTLTYGSGKDIPQEFGIPRTMVFRHLKAYDLQKADGQSMDICRGRQGRCGRPNAVTDPWEVPSISRTSYRKWAVKSGAPLSSLWRLCEWVGARKHKRWVKPVLSDKLKRDRVGFALSHMHRKGGARVVVDDMYGWVHVDEKWFYVMNYGRGIYLHPEEDAPKPPRARNKRFITKVMFLAAVARPGMIPDAVWFDSKIRIWPIAGTVAAMRSSKNRKEGTMTLKPAMLNPKRYKELMIDKVIP